MKKFFLFLNLFFPACYSAFASTSSISSRTSISSRQRLKEVNKELLNTKYANDFNSTNNSYESNGPSSKKTFCIIMFGLLIAGLITYNYLNSQSSYSNPIVI